jgi:hypothetical protein
MTDRRPPTPALEASLEALVMDWVDGVVSDAQGEAMARAAGRPDLVPLVAAMKADKARLAAMARIEPPRFDFEDVVRRLSRADLQDGDDSAANPGPRIDPGTNWRAAQGRHAASSEPHGHPSLDRAPLRATAGGGFGWAMITRGIPVFTRRVLPIAAALVVAGVVVTQLRPVAPRPGPTPSTQATPGPLATAEPSPAADAVTIPSAARNEERTLAMQPLASSVHELDATAAGIPARLVIGADRAMELAREGRLLVRVAAVGEEPAMPPLETMLASDASWRVSDDVSRELLAAVRPFFGADAGVKPEVVVGPPEERFLSADMFGPAELESFAATHTPRTAVNATHAATYVVRLDDDRRVFDQLRRTITTRAAANVLFEEIPGDVRNASGDEPLDARSLVPGRRGLTVPVIVERR